MKRLTKKEFSERVLFYSLLSGLTIALIVWWLEFIKQAPQIIF
jgi:hypothetical protein